MPPGAVHRDRTWGPAVLWRTTTDPWAPSRSLEAAGAPGPSGSDVRNMMT